MECRSDMECGGAEGVSATKYRSVRAPMMPAKRSTPPQTRDPRAVVAHIPAGAIPTVVIPTVLVPIPKILSLLNRIECLSRVAYTGRCTGRRAQRNSTCDTASEDDSCCHDSNSTASHDLLPSKYLLDICLLNVWHVPGSEYLLPKRFGNALRVHSLKRWCGCEHIEKCLLDADNPVNLYDVGYDFATTG
jgi:hypothetical protein